MKRSAHVALGLVAAVASARSQPVADPCNAATFNPKVCRAAVGGGGYCSRGARTPVAYQQAYPYYYDQYRAYLSQGGAVTSSPAEVCRAAIRGGFGATARGHGARAGG